MNKWLRSAEAITFEVSDGVATITLNRPYKRNALTRPMLAELRMAFLEADDRKAVHCAVLQGAGQDFCSGYDMVQHYEMGEGATQTDPTDFDASLYRGAIASVDDDVWRIERNQADIEGVARASSRPSTPRVRPRTGAPFSSGMRVRMRPMSASSRTSRTTRLQTSRRSE